MARVRRGPLTDADRAAGSQAMGAIGQALRNATEPECVQVGEACAVHYPPAEPDDVRGALAAAGYPTAIARVARAGDPAPPGAVVVAVPVEGACLLVYHAAGTGPSWVWVAGQLPGGICLAP